MMSQSHISFYSDSLFEAENSLLDSLPEALELPSSQSSLYEANQSFLPPPPRPACAPRDLVRIGPPLQRVWVLYNAHPDMEDSRKQFVKWWLTTGYGKQCEGQSNMHWDGKKKATVWQGFEQVAHEQSGQPKVMCKECKATLAHPAAKRAGTSSLQHHFAKGGCRVQKVAKKGVNQMLQEAVCSCL